MTLPRRGGRFRAAQTLLLAGIVFATGWGDVAVAEEERQPAMVLYDFRNGAGIDDWVAVNDGVMGGVSSGRLAAGPGVAVFTGKVSLENNGGFASVRSRPYRRDLTDFEGLELRVRGDGRRYKLNLKTDGELDGILYRAAFTPPEGEWRTVRLRFDEFEPTFRGRIVAAADPLDIARITSLGLMISDGQAGPFRLEIASIGVY